ncbi:hypothetical protein BLNAU_15129 [Blattamonas nauphoetae]|uniref:Uncharacterized protein n=1 Tax=Blattamonas nauphoetae TaxID=2049346 RepID=A0ABQ9XBU2_9EUKA|nr:hypothetical protein BLNAU_15129 [Blattamonas nauphoetae]
MKDPNTAIDNPIVIDELPFEIGKIVPVAKVVVPASKKKKKPFKVKATESQYRSTPIGTVLTGDDDFIDEGDAVFSSAPGGNDDFSDLFRYVEASICPIAIDDSVDCTDFCGDDSGNDSKDTIASDSEYHEIERKVKHIEKKGVSIEILHKNCSEIEAYRRLIEKLERENERTSVQSNHP